MLPHGQLDVLHLKGVLTLKEWNGNTKGPLFDKRVNAKIRNMNVYMFACFICKAFDWVSHLKLIEIVVSTRVDAEDVHITKLYWHQTATVRADASASDNISVRKGVHQGCVLSPLLFNPCSESMFREALESIEAGGRVRPMVALSTTFTILMTQL